ncbi:MAG: hypothetical protein KF911_15560 [Pseudomonadales bacterium]|nr:hypothetical protein [Pseudomonadales bacterium]
MNGRWFARVLAGVCALGISAGIAAQSTPADDDFGHRGMTVEERAYYTAQREALVAYVECLKAQYQASRTTTPTSAADACGSERTAYAARLPEDLVGLELDIIDYRVAQRHGLD